jgi:glutamyl endopeptidase
MKAAYSDSNQQDTTNQPETRSDASDEVFFNPSFGHDYSQIENVPGFVMRTSDWSITVPEDKLAWPPASGPAYADPETICGNDDRVQITNTTAYPWKCICKLYITGQTGSWVGSGFFISPKCIITNGHVVFPDGNWATRIEVVPGQNGANGPFGGQIATHFRSVVGWTQNRDSDYDYGTVILPDTLLYDRVRAAFGFQINNNPGVLNTSGYPGDKPRGTQWFNAGPVSGMTPRKFLYMIDTMGGQSGSPVWVNNGAQSISVGVHGYGGCPNKAIRCIEDVARNWNHWTTL